MLIVPWRGELISGKLLLRRHRFLLDVILDNGERVVAHCVNPGRMEGLIRPGARVWLSSSRGPEKNLQWVWELVEINKTLVCTNSWSANKLVKCLIERKIISGFKRYATFNSEVREGRSKRIDFQLISKNTSHYIEVKSVQQVVQGISYFPDSKVVRSQEHIKVLRNVLKSGNKATLLAVVQRADATIFRPSDVHDPIFSSALRNASKIGLKVKAILVEPTTMGFKYCGELPVDLRKYNTAQAKLWREELEEFSGWSRTQADPNASWRKSSPSKGLK